LGVPIENPLFQLLSVVVAVLSAGYALGRIHAGIDNAKEQLMSQNALFACQSQIAAGLIGERATEPAQILDTGNAFWRRGESRGRSLFIELSKCMTDLGEEMDRWNLHKHRGRERTVGFSRLKAESE
jgi:hypothetical protein